MGIGGSNMHSGLHRGRRPFGRGYGSPSVKVRRRAARMRKVSPPHLVPIRHHYHYSYGPYPYMQPAPIYAPPSPSQLYPGYMPMYYNNYLTPPYLFARQPAMIPQQAPYSQPAPASRPMHASMAAPYAPSSSPPGYSAGAPYPGAYGQVPVQPIYNNIVPPPSAAAAFASPSFPSSAPFQFTTGQLSTDWTGGGKISPGFLGPPI